MDCVVVEKEKSGGSFFVQGLSGERDESAKMAVPLASLDKGGGGGGGGGTTLAGYGPVPIIPKTLLDFR